MRIPLEYLGIATVIVSYWETDDIKKRRLMILARLLKEAIATDAVIVESLMLCLEMALTEEWKKFVRMMRGHFLVVVEGRLRDPSSEVADLFHWLRMCYSGSVKGVLQEDCLRVEGGFLVCS